MRSHFKFTKKERSGIFFLLFFILLFQVLYFFLKTQSFLGREMVSLNKAEQIRLDSLKIQSLEKDSIRLFPFNPNFISDYKGYVLGLTPAELDRLYDFRKSNKFVQSTKEFQAVTQISDSLLSQITPYFKFPEWANQNPKKVSFRKAKSDFANKNAIVKDLNTATTEELRSVYGIGEKLSSRIVKFRDRLGGFLSNEQLKDVYGLEPDVIERVLERFKVTDLPKIKKININKASAEEMADFVYFKFDVAQEIMRYRAAQGGIKSLDELVPITGFTREKIDRIGLYLSLTSD